MIRVLSSHGVFAELKLGPSFALPPDTVWVDLLNPTREEEVACERELGASLPTRDEMVEIEASSRLYKDGGATVMTAAVLANSDAETPVEGPVTFVLLPTRLATIRYIEPKAFQIFAQQVEREPQICHSGASVFVALIEALVDRLADVLERTGGDIEDLSSSVFYGAQRADYRPVMRRIGRAQNINAKVRDSLVTLSRLTGFSILAEQIGGDRELRNEMKSVQRDLTSLTEHSDSLSANIGFMLDATLGLISVDQNAIIKFFSVAAVVFLPPTLVASYFGMNFHHMDEFEWSYGEPLAFALMIVSVIVPLWWFKRRGWL